MNKAVAYIQNAPLSTYLEDIFQFSNDIRIIRSQITTGRANLQTVPALSCAWQVSGENCGSSSITVLHPRKEAAMMRWYVLVPWNSANQRDQASAGESELA